MEKSKLVEIHKPGNKAMASGTTRNQKTEEHSKKRACVRQELAKTYAT